jgi:hypothetical protein
MKSLLMRIGLSLKEISALKVEAYAPTEIIFLNNEVTSDGLQSPHLGI